MKKTLWNEQRIPFILLICFCLLFIFENHCNFFWVHQIWNFYLGKKFHTRKNGENENVFSTPEKYSSHTSASFHLKLNCIHLFAKCRKPNWWTTYLYGIDCLVNIMFISWDTVYQVTHSDIHHQCNIIPTTLSFCLSTTWSQHINGAN